MRPCSGKHVVVAKVKKKEEKRGNQTNVAKINEQSTATNNTQKERTSNQKMQTTTTKTTKQRYRVSSPIDVSGVTKFVRFRHRRFRNACIVHDDSSVRVVEPARRPASETHNKRGITGQPTADMKASARCASMARGAYRTTTLPGSHHISISVSGENLCRKSPRPAW